ncbi:MAG: hypothetical protein IKP60_07270 [Treponema sp.]|nr:hypothetical protein [Treponema sp.]
MGVINELADDFKHLVECVDFAGGYDPFGKDFMRAALVGQMWCVMKCMEDDVDDELSGAAKYYIMYKETGDASYKEMAGDELHHAGILIKKHMSETMDESERKKLSAQEKKRNDMLKMLSSETIQIKSTSD